ECDWIGAKARVEVSMLLVKTKTAEQKGAFGHDDYRMGFSSQLAASELVGHGDGRDRRAEAGTGLGRRGTVLPASGGAGADRHGSHRQLPRAGGFAGGVGSRVEEGRCGRNSCHLRAASEDVA